ncbi:TPA: hypothetical protein ACNVHF_003217 [Legionella pneumophila]
MPVLSTTKIPSAVDSRVALISDNAYLAVVADFFANCHNLMINPNRMEKRIPKTSVLSDKLVLKFSSFSSLKISNDNKAKVSIMQNEL